MRSRCSKQESKERMQLDKLSKLKEEPHLSGAYIRSLVKQLTSSRTKDPIMNPKDSDCSTSVVDGDGDAFPAQNLTRFSETTQQAVQQSPQPQQHKKQVRRRLHTSRPYQERLLNMAEARREIVTALKFHRAAMKQQESEQLQQTQQQQSLPVLQPQPVLHPCFEQEAARFKSRRNPRIYPSATTPNFSNYLDNLSYPSFSHPPGSSSYPFSSPLFAPPPPVAENLNFTLPNQPLGLNLNFHDFNNLDTNLYHNNNNSPFVSSSSSPSTSSSSSHTLSIATDQEVPNSVGTPALALADVIESSGAAGGTVSGDLHAAMDDEEMAEIRSIGEQHQMEWNDTMNLVTSAWWFKFLKTMEIEDPDVKAEADDDGYRPFDEVMEFPSWLNANDNCLQQHFNDYCSEDYYQYPALPCMDIGEIEGMDGEWLA